jgi:hypothetical protein
MRGEPFGSPFLLPNIYPDILLRRIRLYSFTTHMLAWLVSPLVVA